MKHKLILLLSFIIILISSLNVNAEDKTHDYNEIVGQWLRPDGGYVLDIKAIQPDGKMEAAYLNPRPINVSKSQANIKEDKIELFIELRDRGYPGSYYTLTYDSETNRLVGVYHHLGLNQNFDVYFVRK